MACHTKGQLSFKVWKGIVVQSKAKDGLLLITVSLMLLGLVMTYSSSFFVAYNLFGDHHHFLLKQLIFAGIALGVLFCLSRIDYHRLLYIDDLLLLFSLGLTFLTLIFKSRWIYFGGFSFQPTELLKLSLIIFLASSISRRPLWRFSDVLPYFVILIAAAAPTIAQPDFGMAMFFGFIVLFMLFIGKVRLSHLIKISLLSLPFIYLLIFQVPYRRARLLSFLDPFRYHLEEGYHIIQSLTAIGSGGVLGKGLGEGITKFYLPSAYNDFIFSVIGEELGLVGCLFLVFAFVIFGGWGIKISLGAPDSFGYLLGAGITFTILAQAGLNLGVTLGILPVTGLTLPFVSYGGSSMVVSSAMVGILLSISRKGAS
jgi:cell division protein FtsW